MFMILGICHLVLLVFILTHSCSTLGWIFHKAAHMTNGKFSVPSTFRSGMWSRWRMRSWSIWFSTCLTWVAETFETWGFNRAQRSWSWSRAAFVEWYVITICVWPYSAAVCIWYTYNHIYVYVYYSSSMDVCIRCIYTLSLVCWPSATTCDIYVFLIYIYIYTYLGYV